MNGQRRPSASGLTAIEIDLLRTVQECTAAADGPYAPSTDVLERLEARTGVGPRYAQRMLGDLTADWVRHLPLLDGEGNFGSVGGDVGAEAQYTQVRLSRVGALALASERGAIGPLPLDLIEGSLYRGGGLPPFDPALTVRALLAGADRPGLPRTPTGTITSGPTKAFRRHGRKVQRYRLGSVFRTGPDAHELVLTEPPYLVGTDTIVASLQNRLDQARLRAEHGDLRLPFDPPSASTPESVPIRDVQNLTSGRTGTWILLALRENVDIVDAVDWVRSVWPATVYADCLPRRAGLRPVCALAQRRPQRRPSPCRAAPPARHQPGLAADPSHPARSGIHNASTVVRARDNTRLRARRQVGPRRGRRFCAGWWRLREAAGSAASRIGRG